MDAPPAGEIASAAATRYQGIVRKVETAVVNALQFLIVLAVAVGTIMLFVLFVNRMRTKLPGIESEGTLQPLLQSAYSGALMVLLGLELLETLKSYFVEHHVRIEVILVVAMISVGRRIIEVDFSKLGGAELIGLGVLVASLAASYFLVKKTHITLPR
jgi:uncharacterized membrane protein (DUF373 family)